MGKGEQMIYLSEPFIRASCSRLKLFVHHVVRNIKLEAQENLFVLMSCVTELFCDIFSERKPYMLYRKLIYINKQIFLHHVISNKQSNS